MAGTDTHAATFLRFVLIGGSFSLIYSAGTAALIRFAGAPPLMTSVILYALCIPVVFYCHKRFAFRAQQTRKMAFPLYLATQVASLALVATVTTRFVTEQFWLDTALFLATSTLAAVLSYLIGRYVTFAPR
jgi:putative flippase GtrA